LPQIHAALPEKAGYLPELKTCCFPQNHELCLKIMLFFHKIMLFCEESCLLLRNPACLAKK
jgi:hypothetical protein